MRSTSPAIQPKSGRYLIFAPALGHQLHTDTNAEKRPSVLPHALLEGVDHARNFVEPAAAIGECADAGQHDAISARYRIGIARHCNWLFVSALTRGAFESLRRRMQIA